MSSNGYLSVTVEVSKIDPAVFENAIACLATLESIKELVYKKSRELSEKFSEEMKKDNVAGGYLHAIYRYTDHLRDSFQLLYSKARYICEIQKAKEVTFDSEDWIDIEYWRRGDKNTLAENIKARALSD